MPSPYRTTRTANYLLGMLALLVASTATQAESAQSLRQRVYQQERQLCLSGQTSQSRETCLREAGAVLQQHTAEQSQASSGEMAANALQRCDAFTGDDRQSCIARVQGQGSVQGSAAGGGILRELTEPSR
jgi:hypothetical protein